MYGNQYKIHPACPASATHSLDHKTSKFIGHHHLTSQDAPIKLPLGVDEMINGDFLIGLPAARYLRCSVITPASHVQCGGAKATETASLEPVGNCSLFNRCKVGGAATAKMFEPVVRFWLEAKELTHHSLQGDTALGRNDQKTVHSHWVGPPAEAKLLISILLFGIGQSFHDTDLLHDANLLPCSHGSAEHLRVTYENKNTSSKAYLLHMCPLNCQHLATNMSCKWGLVS